MASRLKCKELLRSNALLLTTLVGVVVGFGLGFALREVNPSSDVKVWIGLPGEIFLRLLKMMIIPLIVSSVISGTASLDPRSNGKISLIALGFIIATNLLACILGIILAVTIKPGQYTIGNSTASVPNSQDLKTQDIFADLIRNIFPDNLVAACFQKSRTYYETSGINETTIKRKLGTAGSSNIIGIIFCAMVLGIATSAAGAAGKPFHQFFKSSMEVVLKVLRWFMWFTPIGVASLIMLSIINVDDLQTRFLQLGLLILAVTIGVLFQQLVFIPILYFLCFFANPFRFLITVFPSWSIGFAATSTAVAIPEMITCCEKGNGVDKRVSRFVVPFSVTLSANGSALFIVASSIFIGQTNNIEMDAGKVIVIGVLTAVSVMALPPVPSSSIVVIIIILETVSFPVEDVALLLAVEWYLDRMRSGSNAVSHVFCALFTYRFCRDSLPLAEADEFNVDVLENHYINPNVNDHDSKDDAKQDDMKQDDMKLEESARL